MPPGFVYHSSASFLSRPEAQTGFESAIFRKSSALAGAFAILVHAFPPVPPHKALPVLAEVVQPKVESATNAQRRQVRLDMFSRIPFSHTEAMTVIILLLLSRKCASEVKGWQPQERIYFAATARP